MTIQTIWTFNGVSSTIFYTRLYTEEMENGIECDGYNPIQAVYV